MSKIKARDKHDKKKKFNHYYYLLRRTCYIGVTSSPAVSGQRVAALHLILYIQYSVLFFQERGI